MIPSLISALDAISFRKSLLKEGCPDDQVPTAGALQEILSHWETVRIKFCNVAAAEQNQLMFLGFLEEAGVDNWEGYSEAHRMLNEYLNKKEKS